ncbi:AMP-binding protein [Salinispirillum marinum]|uniref:Long-chain-fatty-acid--CoA ligase n=2 Tax=Saccharospirillaceae TaxID=255527 RepID=A0ABV8BDI7_9GAMM
MHTQELDLPNSINLWLEAAYEAFADRPAFTHIGVTLTYSELERLSANLAAYWQHETDLVPGDRVAVLLPNNLQYPIVAHAILRCGFVLVNINPLLSQDELLHQLRDSAPRALVFLEVFGDLVERLHGDIAPDYILMARLGDLHTTHQRFMINTVARYLHRRVPEFDLPNATPFMAALLKGEAHAFKAPALTPDHVTLIQYTLGTTGLARGVMLTQRNLMANVAQLQQHLTDPTADTQALIPGRERVMAPLPLYHLYAFTAHCLCLFSLGAHSILVTNPRDITGLIRTLKQWDVTAMVGIQTLFEHALNHKEFAHLSFHGFKWTLAGGAALTQMVAQRWEHATQAPLVNAYGLSEASPAVTMAALTQPYEGHVGKPLLHTEVSIRAVDGTQLPSEQVGEIWVRGPQVFAGYWNAPETTHSVLSKDGWLRTGDVGRLDHAGNLTVIDRLKDVIQVAGFNVYPSEIEAVVAQHPKVKTCAVVGEPDGHGHVRIHLYVVPIDEAVSDKEMIHYCRARLDGYKVPKSVTCLDSLPQSAVGKVLRRVLRQRTQQQH